MLLWTSDRSPRLLIGLFLDAFACIVVFMPKLQHLPNRSPSFALALLLAAAAPLGLTACGGSAAAPEPATPAAIEPAGSASAPSSAVTSAVTQEPSGAGSGISGATPASVPASSSTSPGASPNAATATQAASSAPSDTPRAPGRAAHPDRNLDDIRAIIAGNRDLFRSCYTHVAAQHPGIQGAYVLHFVLGPDGSVKSADADQAKSDIHAPEMTVCATNVLKTLKFPPSRRGMETTVNYPFRFTPQGPPPGARSHAAP